MTSDAFIQRMIVLYGAPETVDDGAFLDEYRDIIDKSAPAVLRRAGDIIRDTQERRVWPTPAIVRKAVAQAAAELAARRREPRPPEIEFEMVGPEDERFVRALAAARADAPAYAAMIEKRGFIKVSKEPSGPAKVRVQAVVSDLTKRMTGERD